MRLYLIFLVSCFCVPGLSNAQVYQPGVNSIFDLLQQYDPLVVNIEADLKKINNDKDEISWYPASFKVMKGDSVALRLEVQVATRGKMRKQTCDFPPLKIRFYKQRPKNDSMAEINELKLVARCSYLPQYEEWVQREYLIYQLYNLVTEESFRVKSTNIRIEDKDKKNRTLNSFAFFIESEEQMAARLDGRPIKPRVGSTRSLDSTSFDRMSLFQFMIGNTDWSVRARHNIKLIYLNTPKTIIAVPYDFDYAGAVGADYAVPNGDYPIQSVQDRYYLGLCRSTAHYQAIFDAYISKEKLFYKQIEEASYLPETSGKQMIRYLEGYFETLRDPRLAKRDILQNCNKGR